MRPVYLAAALCVSSFAAHADTLVYNVDVSLAGGGTITGTLTLDNTTGLFTVANLVDTGVSSSAVRFTEITDQGQNKPTTPLYIAAAGNVPARDFFDFGVSSFAGYTGSTIPVNTAAADFPPDSYTASSSSVTLETTPAAITPEPSSIALLGTGMLGIAGMVRKRLV